MRKKKLPNLIGSRRILKDLRKITNRMQDESEEALKRRDASKTIEEYEFWRGVAIEKHETARQLDAFIDIYAIF